MKNQKEYENNDISVVKTIRLPKKMTEFLDKIALEENKKFNTIITEEFEKYVNFTYKIRKFSKGIEITISDRFFELILNCLTDNLQLIEENAYKAGKEWGKEYLFLWNKELNNKKYARYKELMHFIGFLDIVSKYSNLFKYDIIEDKEKLTIIAHHNYNYKYSVLLANYYRGFIENITELAKEKYEIELKEKSVIFHFDKNI